jgi:hypothetical protein
LFKENAFIPQPSAAGLPCSPMPRGERAKRFYLAYVEFIEHPADARSLFLPIETVVTRFD